MAFLQDIKGALPAIRGPRYTVTLMGGEAAVVEYRGKPLKISRIRKGRGRSAFYCMQNCSNGSIATSMRSERSSVPRKSPS